MVFYYFCIFCNDEDRVLLTLKGSLYGALILKNIHLDRKLITTFNENFNIKHDKGLYVKYYITGNPSTCLIDYYWNYLITKYFLQKLHLEKTMWNLSTFGGAYSSMGDYFDKFAEVAGKLSIAQYKIAKKMDDQELMSRCKLFFSLSLAQRNHLKLAYYLIKDEYNKAKKDKNYFILDCAKGTLAKIKSLQVIKKYSQKKKLSSLLLNNI